MIGRLGEQSAEAEAPRFEIAPQMKIPHFLDQVEQDRRRRGDSVPALLCRAAIAPAAFSKELRLELDRMAGGHAKRELPYVYGAEVESAIYEHPAVYEVAVFGIHHERLGEELVAAIFLKSGETLTTTALQEHVGHHLASFKVPSRVLFADRQLAVEEGLIGYLASRIERSFAAARAAVASAMTKGTLSSRARAAW